MESPDKNITLNFYQLNIKQLTNLPRSIDQKINILFKNYSLLNMISFIDYNKLDSENKDILQINKINSQLIDICILIQTTILINILFLVEYKKQVNECYNIIIQQSENLPETDETNDMKEIIELLLNKSPNQIMAGGFNNDILLIKILFIIILILNVNVKGNGLSENEPVVYTGKMSNDDKNIVINSNDFINSIPKTKTLIIKKDIELPYDFKEENSLIIASKQKQLWNEGKYVDYLIALTKDVSDENMIYEFKQTTTELSSDFQNTYNDVKKKCSSLISRANKAGHFDVTDDVTKEEENSANLTSVFEIFNFFSSNDDEETEESAKPVDETQISISENKGTNNIKNVVSKMIENSSNNQNYIKKMKGNVVETVLQNTCETIFTPTIELNTDNEGLFLSKYFVGSFKSANSLTNFENLLAILYDIENQLTEKESYEGIPDIENDFKEKIEIFKEIIINSRSSKDYFESSQGFEVTNKEYSDSLQTIKDLTKLFDRFNPVTYRKGLEQEEKNKELTKQKIELERLAHETDIEYTKAETKRTAEVANVTSEAADINAMLARANVNWFTGSTLAGVSELGKGLSGTVSDLLGSAALPFLNLINLAFSELKYTIFGLLSISGLFTLMYILRNKSYVSSKTVNERKETTTTILTPLAPNSVIVTEVIQNADNKIINAEVKSIIEIYKSVGSDISEHLAEIQLYYKSDIPNNPNKIILYNKPEEEQYEKCGIFRGVNNDPSRPNTILIKHLDGSVSRTLPFKYPEQIIDPILNPFVYDDIQVKICNKEFNLESSDVLIKESVVEAPVILPTEESVVEAPVILPTEEPVLDVPVILPTEEPVLEAPIVKPSLETGGKTIKNIKKRVRKTIKKNKYNKKSKTIKKLKKKKGKKNKSKKHKSKGKK
jgi:hypothetical protein